jgi:hypothetical protein
VIFTSAGSVGRLERAALIVALVVAAVLAWRLQGAPTDETYVHLHYARHLASGRGLVFNPGERVYGCASPLWVALIADAMALGFDGLTAARVMGFAAMLASVGFFFQLLRRTVRSTTLRAAGTLVWATHPWLLRWSVSGTETSLAVALTLAGFVAFVEGQTWGSRPRRTGALWALAALTRPEAVVLLLLWGAFLLIDAESREGLRRLVAGATPPLVIYGAWLLFARFYFGTFWPQMLSTPAHGASGLTQIVQGFATQARSLAVADLGPVVLLGLALLLGGARLWRSYGATQRLVPWALVLALPMLYAARRVPVTTQHLVLIAPVLSWLAWRAVDRAWGGGDATAPRRWLPALALAAAALGVVPNLWLANREAAQQTREASESSALASWGRWFGEHTDPAAVVATPEIGAIGFFSDRRVLDLSGLVSPAMLRYLRDESVGDATAAFRFAAFARPDFLVERDQRPYRLIERSRYARALVPLGHASSGGGAAARVYSFYRLDWTAFDSLRAHH